MQRARPGGRALGSVRIPADRVMLDGDLVVPDTASGIVLFAHGSGSSRFSPRNRAVAQNLNEAGLGTLLMDLLTPEEEQIDERTRHLRFDIEMLAGRLVQATEWLNQSKETRGLRIGMFGASTGAGAALIVAARRPELVGAVVSRGGRPDLAGEYLRQVRAPTLLIVGGEDDVVIDLNRKALALLREPKELRIVPGATHLFEEPGTLETVALWARGWFLNHLEGGRQP